MGVELQIVEVSGPNRIPFLMTNKADIVISSFSVTPERAKVVGFSAPYSVNQLVVGAPKSVAISKLGDLAGKRVAVVRGNLQDLELTSLWQKHRCPPPAEPAGRVPENARGNPNDRP